jgi:uncharacterized OB-fold protein
MDEEPFTINSFQNFLEKKRLMGVKCNDCNNIMFPPRIICTKCNSKKLEWHEFKGDGTLETYSILHVAPTFLKDNVPYVVGIIKLKEGPMITGRITDIDTTKSENIEIGTNVKIEFLKESGKTILAFKPE